MLTDTPIINKMRRIVRGGAGSGNFDHAGRPGEVGGSLPSGEGAPSNGGSLSGNFSFRQSKISSRFENAIEDLDSVFLVTDEWGNTKVSGMTGRAEGRYWPDAEKIQINNSARNPEFTFVHESSHLMDYFLDDVLEMDGLTASLASLNIDAQSTAEMGIGTPMEGFWDAIGNSSAIQELEGLRNADPEGTSYLLDVREIFARANTQYVATRSQSPVLLEQLNDVREFEFYPEQWSDDDFAPIAAEFDSLYGDAGLLR